MFAVCSKISTINITHLTRGSNINTVKYRVDETLNITCSAIIDLLEDYYDED